MFVVIKRDWISGEIIPGIRAHIFQKTHTRTVLVFLELVQAVLSVAILHSHEIVLAPLRWNFLGSFEVAKSQLINL